MWCMELLTETYVQLGFASAVVVVFLYLYICKNREDTSQAKKANETITDINKRIFNAFMSEIKTIAEETHENKKLNKDSFVIQAQIQKMIQEHDKYNRETWEKFLPALEKLCDTMNGNNPKIKAIQKEITEMKQIIQKKV